MKVEEERALLRERSATVRTRGRRTGRAHRVVVWFAYRDGMAYFLAHAREHGLGTDWYQNLIAAGEAEIEVAGIRFLGHPVALAQRPGRAVAMVVGMFEDKYGPGAIESWYQPGARIAACLRLAAPGEPPERSAEP